MSPCPNISLSTSRSPCLNGGRVGSASNATRSSPGWLRQAQRLREEALVFYFAIHHPRVPWHAKLVAACVVGYLLSPIQVIPSYIPVIGFLDDFLLLFVGVKVLRKMIPRDALAECHLRAAAIETRTKEEIKSAAARAGVAAVIGLWFLATGIAGALIFKHFFR